LTEQISEVSLQDTLSEMKNQLRKHSAKWYLAEDLAEKTKAFDILQCFEKLRGKMSQPSLCLDSAQEKQKDCTTNYVCMAAYKAGTGKEQTLEKQILL